MDRITALRAIARNFRGLIVDTVPASLSGSSVDATVLIYNTPGRLVGKDFYIYSGCGAGQQRVVGSLDTANRRVIFPQVFTTLPSTNSNFIILDHYTKDEYDNAIDRAIGRARLYNLQESVATMQIVATQHEYPVPSGFDYINSIHLVPSGNSDYGADAEVGNVFDFHPRLWSIRANPVGTYVLVFDPRLIDMDNFDEEWVVIQGQVKPVVNATDNATIPPILEEYVVAHASMQLAGARQNENREWSAKFYMYRDTVNDLEDYIHTPRRGKKIG